MPKSATRLVQSLFDGPLDVVGDVHGEWGALQALLARLGYVEGVHPAGRRLVFVGDLCDRGVDSPAVMRFVAHLVRERLAQCVVGNHEINLLGGGRAHGNHWFFGETRDPKEPELGECWAISSKEQGEFLGFVDTLPLVLARSDLRVVHAAWSDAAVERVSKLAGSLDWLQRAEDERVENTSDSVREASEKAEQKLGRVLYRQDFAWDAASLKLAPAIGAYDVLLANHNPIRYLTFGPAYPAERPFWAGGKWRFSHRSPWWTQYAGPAVLFGHYWRWWQPAGTIPADWPQTSFFPGATPPSMPCADNAFCVDFCIGGRPKERYWGAKAPFRSRLAALRWPERQLIFDAPNPQVQSAP